MNKNRGLFLVIALLLTMNAGNLFGQKEEKSSKYVVNLYDSTFNAEINREGVSIIDFWATWCKPCMRNMPEYDIATKKMHGKVRFYKMDTDKTPLTTKQFAIESIPCMIILKNGKEVQRIIGITQSDRVIAELKKVLNE